MKNKIFITGMAAFMLAGIFFTTGCGKKESTPGNHFVYNDTTYSLSQGLLATENILDSFYVYSVGMLSSDFNVVWKADNPMVIDSITGQGEALVFNLAGKSKDGIEDGTYEAAVSLKKNYDLPVPFTWLYGVTLINYTEINDQEFGRKILLTGGTIKVKNLGNNKYEFTFDITSKENKKLTGYFKATFKPYKIEVTTLNNKMAHNCGIIRSI